MIISKTVWLIVKKQIIIIIILICVLVVVCIHQFSAQIHTQNIKHKIRKKPSRSLWFMSMWTQQPLSLWFVCTVVCVSAALQCVLRWINVWWLWLVFHSDLVWNIRKLSDIARSSNYCWWMWDIHIKHVCIFTATNKDVTLVVWLYVLSGVMLCLVEHTENYWLVKVAEMS